MMKIKQWLLLIVYLGLLLNISGCDSNQQATSQQNRLFANDQSYDLTKAASINVQLGLAYLGQGNTSRAKSKLLLAMKQSPSDPLVQGAMGYFYEQTGEHDQAKTYYLKAISLAPNAGAPENNYGTFLCRRGQYAQSIKHFLKAVQDPNYLQTAEAYENAGLCALKIPDKIAAKDYFEKAVLNDPKRSSSLLALAEINFDQGDYAKAQQNLDGFNQITSPNARSLWLGIRLAQKKGDKNTAASYALLLKSKFKGSKQYQAYRQQEGV